jgi:hypothetical protein
VETAAAPLPKDEAGYAAQLLQSLEPLDAAHLRARLTPAPRTAPAEACGGCSRSLDPSCITCTGCLNSWHPACYQLSRGTQAKSILCAMCRSCERCKLPALAQNQLLLSCGKCGAARHLHCAEPRVSRSIAAWLCGRCVRCEGCGTRQSGAWFDEYTMCEECYVKRRRGDCCPVCTMPDTEGEPAVECAKCRRFVHANGRCDGGTVTEAYWEALKSGKAAFLCIMCKSTERGAASQIDLDRAIDEKLRALGRVGQNDVRVREKGFLFFRTHLI